MALSVPSQRTWTAGYKVAAADLNANVRDAVNFLINPDAAQAHASAIQSIPNATFTAVALDTLDATYNNTLWVTGSNTKFTIVNAATYRLSGMVSFAGNSTGIREACFRVNGSTLLNTAVVPGNTNVVTVVVPPTRIHLNAGDYVELCCYQNSGGSLNTYASSGATFGLVEFAAAA